MSRQDKKPSEKWQKQYKSVQDETEDILGSSILGMISKSKKEEDTGVKNNPGDKQPRVESDRGQISPQGYNRQGSDITRVKYNPGSEITRSDITQGDKQPGLYITPTYTVKAYGECRNFSFLGLLFMLWEFLPEGHGTISINQVAATIDMDVNNLRKRISKLENSGLIAKGESGVEGIYIDLRASVGEGYFTPPLVDSSSSYLNSFKTTTTDSEKGRVKYNPGTIEQGVENNPGHISPGVKYDPGSDITPFGKEAEKKRKLRSFFLATLAARKAPEDISQGFYKWLFSQGREEDFLVSLIVYSLPKAEQPKLYAEGVLKKEWEPSQKDLERSRRIIDAGSVIMTRVRDIGVTVTGKEWTENAERCGIKVGLNLEMIKKSASQIQERIRQFTAKF